MASVACQLSHAGYKFYQAFQDSNIIAAPAAICAACVYALVRYFKDGCSTCAGEIAVAIVMGRVAWSLVGVGRRIVEKEDN
jgi:hypothetical protein